MPDPAPPPGPGPQTSNATADTSNNAALGAKLYPAGAENEAGGGTGQSTSSNPGAEPSTPAAAAEPPASPPKAEGAPPPQGEGEKAADPTSPDKAGEPPALTVESYAKLTLPEGFQVNDPLLGEYKTLAAETGIAPEAAQKFMDLYGRAIQEQTKQVQDAWNTTQSEWSTALKAMPELQGEREAQTTMLMGRVLDEFVGAPTSAERQAFNQAMNATGMGNNPHLYRLILDMASALVEDEPPPPGSPAATESRRGKSLGQIIYPTPPSN